MEIFGQKFAQFSGFEGSLLTILGQRPATFFSSESEQKGTKLIRSLSNQIHSVAFDSILLKFVPFHF